MLCKTAKTQLKKLQLNKKNPPLNWLKEQRMIDSFTSEHEKCIKQNFKPLISLNIITNAKSREEKIVCEKFGDFF
jgi:hypothetical protein